MRVLVTSANRKIPLLRAIQEQLPAAEIVAADAAENCLAAYAWPQFATMPRITSVDPAALAEWITGLGIDVVIPTRDADVAYFSEHRSRYADAGIWVMASSIDSVRDCLDKWEFANRLSAVGLPAIPTSTSLADAETFGSRLVLKERRGAGSAGLHIDIDPAQARSAAALLDEPIIQPFITGPEVSVDAYRSVSGRTVGYVVRSRDLVVQGESQVTTVVDSAPYSSVVEGTLAALDVTGHVVLQIIDAPAGPVVVECNPRVGGASTLALRSGLDSLAWFTREASGEDPGTFTFPPVPVGTRLIRTPVDEIHGPGL